MTDFVRIPAGSVRCPAVVCGEHHWCEWIPAGMYEVVRKANGIPYALGPVGHANQYPLTYYYPNDWREVVKKIVEEVSGEGLECLLGENVALWCANYIYAGRLVGVNENDVLLENAKVVYETGPLDADSFKDAQLLPGPWYVRTSFIESYGVRNEA